MSASNIYTWKFRRSQENHYQKYRSFVSINSAQSFHHFIVNSEWSVSELKSRRLAKIKKALNGNAIIVVIDETHDRKKGKTTDYVARLYLV